MGAFGLNTPSSNNPGLYSETSLLASTNNNYNGPNAVSDYYAAYTQRVVIAPVGVGQIGAFVFDYEGADDVSMANDITDHWLEDNTTVQDQIGVRSNIITLRGYVSELALQASVAAQINSLLNTVECALSQAPAYLGKYSPGATQDLLTAITQVQNVTYQIEQAAARVAQIANFFLPIPNMNKQQAAFAQLSALRNARTLFTVYTPFQVFFNCAIMSLRAVQGERSNTISDFTVSMKQLQFSNNISAAFYASSFGGNSQYSNQVQSSNGITAGTPVGYQSIANSFAAQGSAIVAQF